MRNYGLTQRAGGPGLTGGNHQHPARLPIAPNVTQRNLNSLPPLPAQSLRDEPITSTDRERAVGKFLMIFFGLWFAVPIGCIFYMLKFR